jgi:cellulose synthase (UDP-forming)
MDRTESPLPSPPTDQERDSYFKRYIAILTGCGTVGMAGVVWATVHLSLTHEGLRPYLLLVAIATLFFAVSLWLTAFTRDEDAETHRGKVDCWSPSSYPAVDVWLPVCGEPLTLLANTWRYVQTIEWAGELEVYISDDGADPAVERLAGQMGFHYLSRPDRGYMSKAGNLRYLYEHSAGDFAVIFDADFCPRPDFLAELMPYFDEARVGIVQSPQYFRVLPEQHWLERGAGAVQELFYRAIQVARQQRGDAICVGTNAIYRRAALDENGGTTLIQHSEDVHTGFDLRCLGWRLRYVPVVLATGICPDDLHGFMRQQYRWCMGSVSLVGSRKFWRAQMPIGARASYLTGLGYYLLTAINAVLYPVLPLVLMVRLPEMVKLHNYIYLLPALCWTYVGFPAWHRCRWGVEAWTVQLLYGWAHLFAIADILRRKPMGWTPTGAARDVDKRARPFRAALICWSATAALGWVALSAYRVSEHADAFLPMAVLGCLYLLVVGRIFAPAKRYST